MNGAPGPLRGVAGAFACHGVTTLCRRAPIPAAVRTAVRWQDGHLAAKQLSMSNVQLGSIQASPPFGVQNVFASKIPLPFPPQPTPCLSSSQAEAEVMQ